MGQAEAKVKIVVDRTDLDQIRGEIAQFQSAANGQGSAPTFQTPYGMLNAPRATAAAEVALPPEHTVHPAMASEAAATAGSAQVGAQMAAKPAQVAMPHQQTAPSTIASPPSFGTWNGENFSALSFDPFVGRFFDPSTKAYYLSQFQNGQFASRQQGAPPQTGAKAGSLADNGLWSVVGGAAAGEQLRAVMSEAASAYGTSQVTGKLFHPQTLAPEGIALGATVLGAAIGSAIPGVGTLLGAGVGAAIGGVGEALDRPYAEQSANYQDFRRISMLEGLGDPTLQTMPLMDTAMHAMMRGRAISNQALQTVGGLHERGHLAAWFDTLRWINPEVGLLDKAMGWMTGKEFTERLPGIFGRDEPGEVPSELAAPFLDNLNTLRYDPAIITKFKDIPKIDTPQQQLDLLEASAYVDPETTLGTVRALKRSTQLTPVQLVQVAKIEASAEPILIANTVLDSGIKADQAEASVQVQQLQLEARNKGSVAAAAFIPQAQATLRDQAEKLDEKAQLAPNDEVRRQYRAQALAARISATTLVDVQLGAMSEETNAFNAASEGHAQRAFDRALYSGVDVDNLPWDDKVKALRSEKMRFQEEKQAYAAAGRLSPARETMYNEQIAQKDFQIEVEVPRQKEEMQAAIGLGKLNLKNAQERTAALPSILTGSVMDSTKEYDLQIDAEKRKQEWLEKQLSTRKELTEAQRDEYKLSIEQSKQIETYALVEKQFAVAEARRETFLTALSGRQADTQISYLSGGTAEQIRSAKHDMVTEARDNVKSLKAEIAEMMRTAKTDEDNKKIQEKRRELNSARVDEAQAFFAMSQVEPSSGLQIEQSHLSTQEHLMEMGYGDYSKLRGNLRAQAKAGMEWVKEIDEAEAAAKKTGPITEAMKAAFAKQRDAAVNSAFDAYQKSEYGWQDRLIARAIDMPADSPYFTSQFTRKEYKGPRNPAFGGSSEDTTWFRNEAGEFARKMGIGNPETFADFMAGGVDPTKPPTRESFKADFGPGPDPDKRLSDEEAKRYGVQHPHGIDQLRNNTHTAFHGHPEMVQSIRLEPVDVKAHIEVKIELTPEAARVLKVTPKDRNTDPTNAFKTARDMNENPYGKKNPSG